jgi:hypothetical protein
VRHLPGLGISVLIRRDRLEICQALQRAPGEIRVHNHILQAHDQTVATEDRDKPGDSGGGEQFSRMVIVPRQPQGGHVFD